MNLSDDHCWDIVQQHDARYDGLFIVGVMSTKIYCKPSCPARPHRKNVRFFKDAGHAQQAGLRACKRCHPDALSDEALLVHAVCRYIDDHPDATRLAEISQHTGYSAFHLSRQFKRVLGISPRQYATAVRQHHLMRALKQGHSVISASYEAGFTSLSSMYYAQRQRTSTHEETGPLYWSSFQTTLGELIMVHSDAGFRYVGFVDDEHEKAVLRASSGLTEFPPPVPEPIMAQMRAVVASIDGTYALPADIAVDIRMTAFQELVWQALRTIPYGSTQSYSEIARQIGRPTAVRAVAHACAHNPVAVIIPCHRVIHADGSSDGYRWGTHRKQHLIAHETMNRTLHQEQESMS